MLLLPVANARAMKQHARHAQAWDAASAWGFSLSTLHVPHIAGSEICIILWGKFLNDPKTATH